MTVYIEYVIIDNFAFTFALGALSQRVSGISVQKLRVVVASLFSTIVTLFYPFITSTIALMLVKVALWILLSLILFYKLQRTLKCAIIFLLLTFLFGGIIFGINFLITKSAYDALRLKVTSFPLGILPLALVLGYTLVKKMSTSIKRTKDAQSYIYSFELTLLGKKIKSKGLLDTGNRLYDDKRCLPIVIISAKRIIEILSDEQIGYLLRGQGEKIQDGARYLNVTSVTEKSGKILLLYPQKFVLYYSNKNNIICNVTVGVSFQPMTDAVKYDAILHPSLVK